MRKGIGVGVLALLTMAPAAYGEGTWLHVKVDGGDQGESVKINLPIALVESVLPAIETSGLKGGKVRMADLDHGDLDGIDFRAIWDQIRTHGDMDLLTVQGTDESVRVAVEGNLILVSVDDGRNGEQVRLNVPVPVVEAMFSGPDDEIDLVAALRALEEYGGGDLIQVQGPGESVRIWIDRNPSID